MIKKVLLLTVFLWITALLSADPINNLIENSGNSEDYPGSDLLVIFDSTTVDVQESGLSYVNEHQLFKILTAKGAKQKSTITYRYDPQSAYVEIKKVIIYRKDGNIEELDMKDVMDYPAPARMIYWGSRKKMIEVGRLEPGDAVEVCMFKKGFTYALLFENGNEDEKYIPPMKGHFYDIVPFWTNNHISEKVYITKIPKDKMVQYEFYNGEVRCSAHLVNDKIVYTFTKTDIKPFKREPNMVATSDEAPKLLISTSPDWYAKSRWFYGVNEDYGSFESTPEIDKKVAEILEGAEDLQDSISRLTHWVADEIRYSGISMGEGEGYTLHTGDMTFTDRCGVCKDKAGMLVTMLRAAGLESYAAMTMAGSRIDYIPADQFNHSVTIVKLPSGEYELLDPTWVPFVRELWSSREQQQNYLMGLPEGADLEITPISAPENHELKITGNSQINTNGTLTGEITLTSEGQSDAALRNYFVRNYRSRWDETIKRELMKISPKIEILELNYGNPYEYLDEPIKINIKYKIPGYAIKGSKELIFHPVTTSGIFKRAMQHLYINTSLEDREYNFRDSYSRLVKIRETISIPEDYIPIINYESESFSSPAASFSGNIEFEDNKIHLKEDITLIKRIYEPEEWQDFKKAVNAQKSFDDQIMIITANK